MLVLAPPAQAEFLGFGGGTTDGSNPFTLYGSTFKKYLIEQFDEGTTKIVARKRGFTAETCVAGIAAADETQRMQGLPAGEKVRAAGNMVCRKAEGQDLKATCTQSCTAACTDTLEQFVEAQAAKTGIAVEEKVKARVLRSCIRDCSWECSKTGRAFDFVVPSRR